MISAFDLLVIGLYLPFLCLIGWALRRFARSVRDYFASGHRMAWWLLGADSFLSNFSAWIFTGAAAVAATYGPLIFGFFLADVLGFALAYFWFAARTRQLGAVTTMDPVRLRFGPAGESFFAFATVLGAVALGTVRVLGLTVILSSAFQLPPMLVVTVTMAVIVLIALWGGHWAVAAVNFVQLAIVVGVTVVIAALAIHRVGGPSAFIAQIPDEHWRILKPLGTIPYDWLFLFAGLCAAAYSKNSLLITGKYLAAQDSRQARYSALVPLIGYVVMPAIWMIPAFASHTLAPELVAAADERAAESAYITVATFILPTGLIGLLIVSMMAVTISSVGVSLNLNAGSLARNFYRTWRSTPPDDHHVLVVGKFATVFLGLVITAGCYVLTNSDVTLFDTLLYVAAYLGIPISVPLFLGLFVRRGPDWAGWSTTLVGLLLTALLYHVVPSAAGQSALAGWWGEDVCTYVVNNRYVVTALVVGPLAALYFGVVSLAWPKVSPERQTFFVRLHTPVVRNDAAARADRAEQARWMSRATFAAVVFIAGLALLPNPSSARWSILACAAVPAAVSLVLLISSRRRPLGA